MYSRPGWTKAAKCPQCKQETMVDTDGKAHNTRRRVCLSCNLCFSLVFENARGWYRTGVKQWAVDSSSDTM